jgi:tripartite-type tricarboxylate transporter receptor subunit TctC
LLTVVAFNPASAELLVENLPNGLSLEPDRYITDAPKGRFIRDITPVATVSRVPNIMAVPPSFSTKTIPEFIAYAKPNQAMSIWRRPAMEPRNMCPANCSR